MKAVKEGPAGGLESFCTNSPANSKAGMLLREREREGEVGRGDGARRGGCGGRNIRVVFANVFAVFSLITFLHVGVHFVEVLGPYLAYLDCCRQLMHVISSPPLPRFMLAISTLWTELPYQTNPQQPRKGNHMTDGIHPSHHPTSHPPHPTQPHTPPPTPPTTPPPTHLPISSQPKPERWEQVTQS
jgi:hypothetical protein